MMYKLDPDDLEGRNLQKRGEKQKCPYTPEGPSWAVSLDGHDKLCGFQNSTFPIGGYGCIFSKNSFPTLIP